MNKKQHIKRQEQLLHQQQKTAKLLKIAITLVSLILIFFGIYLYQMPKKVDPTDQITIMLDAGCDQKYKGATGYCEEVVYNQAIVDQIAKKLKQDPKYNVIYTHDANTNMSVVHRVDVINQTKPDLTLSMHLSDSNYPNDQGMKIFIDPIDSKKKETSLRFAQEIQKEFTKDGQVPFIGYCYYEDMGDGIFNQKEEPLEHVLELSTLPILSDSHNPIVYVNAFYASNEQEVNEYTSEEGIDNAADLYCRAIQRTFEETEG